MMNQFTATQRIGDTVARFPAAADVFKMYRIDFCCGGDRPLREALQEQQLNEPEVINHLNERFEAFKNQEKVEVDWTKESPSKLIDHVVNTHHAYLQTELPSISELSAKILRVHGAHHPELATVHRLFHNLKMELEQHLIKEEEIEFPLIKEWEKNLSEEKLNNILKIVTELEDEHVGAGDILKELRRITQDYTVPEDGCNTFRLTYQKLEALENDTFQHIHLENNILFQTLKPKS